jgi:ankyrin repeat protein
MPLNENLETDCGSLMTYICSALGAGACMLRQDREGLTALGWACLRGRVQAAQCLLDRGANVNHADKTGRTPLDLAAFQGNPSLVQVRA